MIKLELSKEEFQLVINGLAELPAKASFAAIQKLLQAQQQQEAAKSPREEPEQIDISNQPLV